MSDAPEYIPTYKYEFIILILTYPICSLLVFAQRQSNQRLAFFMVFSFYLQCILGNCLAFGINSHFGFEWAYWISTAHPISRIPVFFMGVCAGVLCMRIKEQDYDAMNCKLHFFPVVFVFFKSHIN